VSIKPFVQFVNTHRIKLPGKELFDFRLFDVQKVREGLGITRCGADNLN
jgi:hypothetical protein